MPAENNTPPVLGGTENLPDRLNSNRETKDLCMAPTPHHSRARVGLSGENRDPALAPKVTPHPPMPFTLSPRWPGGEGGVRGAAETVCGAAHLALPDATDQVRGLKAHAAPGPLPLPPGGRRGAFLPSANTPSPVIPAPPSVIPAPPSVIPAKAGTQNLPPAGTGGPRVRQAAPELRGGGGQPADNRDRTREILFLDAGISDIETLLGHLRPEVEAILLDPVRPAAHQIAAAAAPAEISLPAPKGSSRGGEGRGEVGAAPNPQRPPQAVSYAAAAATPLREILFIDPGISDIETLLGNLRPEVEAILLDPARPAARQIAAAVAGRHGLGAVHVIAHGAPGRVSFAAGDWSAATLEEEAEDLAAIGQTLGAGRNVNLWSCQTAAGPAGAAFIAGLARASGADIAAATGLVGDAALGDGWELTTATQRPLTAPGMTGYDHQRPSFGVRQWLI